jgi:hypothetical protein
MVRGLDNYDAFRVNLAEIGERQENAGSCVAVARLLNYPEISSVA